MNRVLDANDLSQQFVDFTVTNTLPDRTLWASTRITDVMGNVSPEKGMSLGAITGGSVNLQVDTRPAPDSNVPYLLVADGSSSSTVASLAARTATTTANRLFTLQGDISARSANDSTLDVVYVEVFDRLNDANKTLISLGKASVKGGAWFFTYTGSELVQGLHTLVVRSVDFAGNLSHTDQQLKDSTATLTLNVNNASVTTEPADRIAPTLVDGISFDGTQMTLVMSELVQTSLPASAFAVAVNGQLVTVSSVVVNPADRTRLTITLAQPVFRGQQITLAYTDPSLNNEATGHALQDDAGNDVAMPPLRVLTEGLDAMLS
jgi:hypothetical protein